MTLDNKALAVFFSIVLVLSVVPSSFSADQAQPGTTKGPASSASKRLSADEMDTGRPYWLKVNTLLQQENFPQLDQMADAARTAKERWPGGGWKLFTFYSAIEYPVAPHYPLTDADWESHINLLQRWTASNPASVTARVALAQAYLDYGWKARGHAFASEVTDEQWDLLHKRVALAKQALQEASRIPDKCPHWYTVAMDIALVDGSGREKTRSLIERAIKFEPTYYYTYDTYLLHLLPKWGGEQGESEQFAHNIADAIGGKVGDAIYFNLAVNLNCPPYIPDEGHLETMSWKRIQRGYAALEELYGLSLPKLNQFAYLAVQKGDGLVARQLFDRIGENYFAGVWTTEKEFRRQKRWALRWKPSTYEFPKAIAPKAPVAEPNEVEAIRAAAKANMDTEAGEFYFKLFTRYFGQNTMPTFQRCLRLPNNDVGGSFDMFVQVAEDGTIQDVRMWPQTNMAECVTRAVKTGNYPRPPAPSYWLLFPVTMPSQPISQHPPQQTPVE